MFTPYGWGLIGVVTLSVGVGSYFAYPWLETTLLARLKAYVDAIYMLSTRMFLPLPKKTIIFVIASGTLGGGAIGFFISQGYGWGNLLFTVFFAWMGGSALRLGINLRWQGRIAKFDNQLIDALTLLANSLKSGLNLTQAVQVLVAEMPDPLAQEFGVVLSQEKIGLTLDEALEKMLERIPSDDLAVAIHSILILRETGGDLSETFEVIANTIRERRKVDGKVKSLTQQGKTQAVILMLMPLTLMFVLYLMNPDYLTPLLTTQEGWLMLAGMVFLQAMGGLWLRKIIKIEV